MCNWHLTERFIADFDFSFQIHKVKENEDEKQEKKRWQRNQNNILWSRKFGIRSIGQTLR